jgi:hypothetical protein
MIVTDESTEHLRPRCDQAFTNTLRRMEEHIIVSDRAVSSLHCRNGALLICQSICCRMTRFVRTPPIGLENMLIECMTNSKNKKDFVSHSTEIIGLILTESQTYNTPYSATLLANST